MLLVALFYGPWAYGCTSAETMVRLECIMGLALALWAVSFVFTAAHPTLVSNLSVLLPGVAGAIIALGWWMTANGHEIYDPNFLLFIGRREILAFAPGSVDGAISAAWMWRATLMIGVIFLAADFARSPVWLLRLWWTVTIVGGSIAILGLVQKATGAEMIFWQRSEVKVASFFATYFYHANAGAYLNLALPPAIGLCVRAFVRKTRPHIKVAASLPCLLLLAAAAANTSRMSQFVAVLIIIGSAFYFRSVLYSISHRTGIKASLLVVGVLAAALLAIAYASQFNESLTRWEGFTSKVGGDARWLAARAALRAVGDAGLFGFGPGTFRVIFPYYTAGIASNAHGTWRFLHEDYIQTLLEWGWLGSAFCAVLFFGGMAVGATNLRMRRRVRRWIPRQRLFLPTVILALAGIAIHALVDFPLQIASLQLYVAVYLGICWGSSNWSGKNPSVTQPRRDVVASLPPRLE